MLTESRNSSNETTGPASQIGCVTQYSGGIERVLLRVIKVIR
jgi:hypothetical protein